jgi:hypothetical protein
MHGDYVRHPSTFPEAEMGSGPVTLREHAGRGGRGLWPGAPPLYARLGPRLAELFL